MNALVLPRMCVDVTLPVWMIKKYEGWKIIFSCLSRRKLLMWHSVTIWLPQKIIRRSFSRGNNNNVLVWIPRIRIYKNCVLKTLLEKCSLFQLDSVKCDILRFNGIWNPINQPIQQNIQYVVYDEYIGST